MTSGHGPFAPTVLDTGSQNVFINGQPQVQSGMVQKTPHTPMSLPQEPPRVMGPGSSTVNINGSGAIRLMDQTTCSGFVMSGSSNVLIG